MEHEKICRLCLQQCPSGFQFVKESVTKILGFLSKSDLFINKETVMCENCTESIKSCSNFKKTCLDVDKFIVQCINSKNSNAKLNLKETNDIPKDHDICRLCMASLRIGSFISLDGNVGDVTMGKMMEKCLPELDLRVTEKPVICAPCRESLQYYFGFITNCRNVEENIKKHCEAAGMDGTNPIKLKDVREFTVEQEFVNVDEIKVEDRICVDGEQVHEGKCSQELPSILKSLLTKKDVQVVNLKEEDDIFLEEIDCKVELKCENLTEMEEPTFENVDDQEHLNRFEVDIDPSQPVVTTRVNGLTPNLEEDHSSTPPSKNSPTNVYFSARYKCNLCPFQTKYKQSLQSHLLDHKDPSEVEMYNCNFCLYQTRQKNYLVKHSLRHKNSSEVTTYNCGACSYQTRYKNSFNRHVLKHKVPSGVTMCCDSCSFQTKYEKCLKLHMLKHMDRSEVTTYKCNFCSYQTIYKRNFDSHMVQHKDHPEVPMHECDSCSYETKFENAVKSHSLQHKETLNVTMYKCDCCSYQTNYKKSLKTHMLRHKDPSEVRMYKCDACSYQTIHKESLKRHLLKHKDPSEVTMHRCELCSFQTKYKKSLGIHLLKHMDPSDVAMYKCDSCSFQTKHKTNLDTHLLTHMDRSEVTTYKCDLCSFQTLYKTKFKKHVLHKHKDPL